MLEKESSKVTLHAKHHAKTTLYNHHAATFRCRLFALAPHHAHQPYLLPMPPFASFFGKHEVSFSFNCNHPLSLLLFYGFCFSFHVLFVFLMFVE
jgi:hypothetical protein